MIKATTYSSGPATIQVFVIIIIIKGHSLRRASRCLYAGLILGLIKQNTEKVGSGKALAGNITQGSELAVAVFSSIDCNFLNSALWLCVIFRIPCHSVLP